jgi:hypothetical protein
VSGGCALPPGTTFAGPARRSLKEKIFDEQKVLQTGIILRHEALGGNEA